MRLMAIQAEKIVVWQFSFNRRTLRSSLPSSSQYWFHPAIHTFGNVGFLGGVHSVAAPLATKIIDTLAYNGRSVREEIGVMLRDKIGEESKKVIDMGCGVGIR
jgi:hypothetical protein